MDFDILDLIYTNYEGYCLSREIKEERNETAKFKNEYIEPLLEEDSVAGKKMETMFECALEERDAQSFKKGFRVCMRFMTDCLKKDL